LATGERLLAQRACMIAVMSEDIESRWLLGEPVDAGMLCTLTNARRRVFETLGLQRRLRDTTPTLAAYLAIKAEAADEAE
jgi:hypothetical protein